MLSAEKNERLTRVGPGTPMGELLRRYWWPIATHDVATRVPVKRRLLGEDLVLYRDGSGTVGLLAEQCPHRRAALWLGAAEEVGLRCGYHGWRFDADGRCLEQPGEPAESTFRDRIRATAYPVQELGGLVFAYLGPAPVPQLPRYDLFVWDDAWRDIGHAELPCNFVQIMENSVDPYHVEWLHGRYGSFLRGESLPVVTKMHVKVAFEVFEHGILKRRVLEGHTEEDDDWKVGHPLVFPHMLRVGAAGLATFQIPGADRRREHLARLVPDLPARRRRAATARDPAARLRRRAGHRRVDHPGADLRPVAREPRPLGPRRDPAAQALRAADGTGGTRRGPAVHLPRPARRDRPADGARQVRLGRRVPADVDAESTIRYSPIRDDVFALFGDPVPAWT
jgi:5,5'-dehydrodivanillate O-demethylase